MLTYNPIKKPKRKDRPWLLFVMALIWVLGTAFFHSPWEPYEPFVLAVVKGILLTNSWFVPYVSNVPYLKIQPFYFWIYSAVLKLFDIHNIYSIANSIRILNTVIIFAIVILVAKIGSGLSAFKNGRTVVLILISSVGFINNAYQLSPNILVLLGFCLYLYALQLYLKFPGISGWILFLGLLLISLSFTVEFIVIALLVLILLPLIDRYWRNLAYIMVVTVGVTLFGVLFFLYVYQLNSVNEEFFLQWKNSYGSLFLYYNISIWQRIVECIYLLSWYVVPGWFLVIWSIYRRKLHLFEDKIIQVSILLIVLLLIFGVLSGREIEGVLFPIIIPVVFIASLEVDSIRISIVSLLNWFSIFIFGVAGGLVWLIYFSFNFSVPRQLVDPLLGLSQHYVYKLNLWHLFLASIITFIWLFMITRSHIRGRELITNWASGTTFVVVLFLALCLPWFDSVLSFRSIVENSIKHLDRKFCIATNAQDSVQGALWYYYADINLMPAFSNIDYGLCNQAVIATNDINTINQQYWYIVWQDKRPIDKKVYYVIKHK